MDAEPKRPTPYMYPNCGFPDWNRVNRPRPTKSAQPRMSPLQSIRTTHEKEKCAEAKTEKKWACKVCVVHDALINATEWVKNSH